MTHFSRLLSVIVLIIVLTGCSSPKEVLYLQDLRNDESLVNTIVQPSVFKVNDILNIYVSAFDMQAVAPFNLTTSNGEQMVGIDYIIDKDGYIDYPVVGKVKLLGLTVEQGKQMLTKSLERYLKDPIVNIRITNFRVTILGEVNRPGTYPISGEQITLLEALGLAGDMKIKARRDNIMIIRETAGVKTSTMVDITSKKFLNSPAYYLTQNDVVYVQPNKSAISQATTDSRFPTVLSILGLLLSATILITR